MKNWGLIAIGALALLWFSGQQKVKARAQEVIAQPSKIAEIAREEPETLIPLAEEVIREAPELTEEIVAEVSRAFGPKGDVNGDGKIDDSDVRTLTMFLEGTVNIQGLIDSSAVFRDSTGYVISKEATHWRCDMNGDGVIDRRDLALLEEMVGYHWR